MYILKEKISLYLPIVKTQFRSFDEGVSALFNKIVEPYSYRLKKPFPIFEKHQINDLAGISMKENFDTSNLVYIFLPFYLGNHYT